MSASLPNETSVAADLVALSGDDETRAHEALARLWESTRPVVERMLGRRGLRGADAEDLCQSAFVQIWRWRSMARARSRAEWHGLVRRQVYREIGRRSDRHRKEATALGAMAIPEAELPYLEAMIEAREAGEALYDLADRLWLGEPAEPDAEVHACAAQLVLVDGLDPAVVARAFGAEPDDVDRWLRDPAVLARALFACVCWPSDDLAAYVLRPERPLSARDLDALGAEGVETAWTPREARIVAWRLRNGLRRSEIVRLARGEVSPEELEGILGRMREALPFRRLARALAASLARRGRSDALSDPELWKRVAFEYAVRADLPASQIVERAGPPAGEAGFVLDQARLRNWLSAGRLFARLAAFAGREPR